MVNSLLRTLRHWRFWQTRVRTDHFPAWEKAMVGYLVERYMRARYPKVTFTDTGAIRVDVKQLIQSDEFKAQLKAVRKLREACQGK